jgi:hypothetical protein
MRRANAEAIKTRLEKKLVEDSVPKGNWTDVVFRLGRAAQEIKKATSKWANAISEFLRQVIRTFRPSSRKAKLGAANMQSSVTMD